MTDVETCNLCNKPNDQMLMLSCVHDPCINCAASAYAEQIHLKGQSKQLYICQICGEQTLLDSSTVTELTALANSVIKTPSKINPLPNKNTNLRTANKPKQTQQPNYPSISSSSLSKKIVYYCKQHSQQQISYYCFLCGANICPECAIHGSHKDHDVKLIKKAISQVKGEYQEILIKVGDTQNSMSKLKEAFLRLIKQANDRHTREKNTVTRQFDIIRAALVTKQKQMIRELDEINKQNVASLTSFLQIINSSSEEANKAKRSIETINKKDEVLILEDYRKIGQLQQAVLALNKKIDSISGQSLQLNVEFLQQECKQLIEGVAKIKISLKKQEVGSAGIFSRIKNQLD